MHGPPRSACRPGAWSLPHRRGQSDPTPSADPPRRRSAGWPRSGADRAASSGHQAAWRVVRTGASPSRDAWVVGRPDRTRTHTHPRTAAPRSRCPLGAAAPMLLQEPHAVLRQRESTGGVGLGVLLHQPARGLEQVPQNQELARLQVSAPPPQRAQLPAPSTRRRGQPQQDREVRVRRVGRLQQPRDLLGGGRSDLSRAEAGRAGQGRRVGGNPAPAGP
jgi:hypothetical protein